MAKLNPATRGFIAALLILAGLMAVAGLLTRVVPAGAYQRVTDAEGNVRILPDSYRQTGRPDYPLWRLATAPLEVLGSGDAATAVVIGLFIVIVGGAFAVLGRAGLIEASVGSLAARFGRRRQLFLALVCLLFMAMGSMMGVFEELVPLVPLTIALSLSLGWDVFTGLGMSILAVGFGFSAGIANPFTVGTAQKLAGLELMSGTPLRLLVFIVVYLVYMAFMLRHVRRLERSRATAQAATAPKVHKVTAAAGSSGVQASPPPARGLRFFAWSGAALFLSVFVLAVTRLASDLLLPVIALGFLVIGIGSGLAAGLKRSSVWQAFGSGALGVAPAFLLILMALSVKNIIVSGGIMDTILYQASRLLLRAGPYQAASLMFGLTLCMNFFVGSASGKAFLLIPLLAPLAELSGLSAQIAVQAFIFGDGFSNMLYPTNAVLLVALGLSGMSWPEWFRRTWLLQLLMLVVSLGFLLLAVVVGYR